MENSNGKSVFDLDANLVAMLCYLGNLVCMLGLVLSIITVISDKKNKLARFHAWQSILLSIFPFVLIIVWVFVSIVGSIIGAATGSAIFSLIMLLVSVAVYLLMIVVFLALLVGEIMGAIKAYNGELFKLPIIGKMADKYSG